MAGLIENILRNSILKWLCLIHRNSCWQKLLRSISDNLLSQCSGPALTSRRNNHLEHPLDMVYLDLPDIGVTPTKVEKFWSKINYFLRISFSLLPNKVVDANFINIEELDESAI